MFSLAITPIGYALGGLLAGPLLGITPTLWLAAAIAVTLAAAVPLIPDIRRLEMPRESITSATPVAPEPEGSLTLGVFDEQPSGPM